MTLLQLVVLKTITQRVVPLFPCCLESHYESELKLMKTNFHNKTMHESPAFIMRFKTTRKWPIVHPGLNDD